MSLPAAPRPRRSMLLWAVLAIAMVVFSYLFIIMLAAACVYLPFQLLFSESSSGTNALLLFGFGLVIAGGLLWSLVPRPDKFTPPGPTLTAREHPRLFAELEKIALSLREPMPSEVYLIGDVNAWVADRGGILGFGSRRVMGLGLPLMSALTVSQFRAVLAHEFAHYYGGDTSLGPWVYKTKMAMIRSFKTMGSLGGLARQAVLAVMHTVVSFVLESYFKLFLRAINFVSRKQEFRADELACLVAGRQPLIDGLQVIHGAAAAWQPYWNDEVVPVLNNGRKPALGDGFARFLRAPLISEQVTRILDKELQDGKATPYDTHPPLRERIAAAQLVAAPEFSVDSRPASSLLEHPDAAELHFIHTLNPDLPADALTHIEWDKVPTEVTVPFWRKLASDYGQLFEGVTCESVPDVIPRLSAIGESIRDPKGMLLSREQRTQRAAHLVGVGLALTLLANGWELHSEPGIFHFQKGTEKFSPFATTYELLQGKITRESWLTRCQELGIFQRPLFPSVSAAITASAAEASVAE